MPTSGLLVSQMHGVTVVNFRHTSILDAAAIEVIRKELCALIDEQARRKVILDFAHVKFLSSTMLGVLIDLHKKSRLIDGKIVVCGLRPQLYKVCKIMNLHKLLEFADDEEQALNSFDVFTNP